MNERISDTRMPDLKDDLAALRIEREPERPGARPLGRLGRCSLVLLGAGGFGGWRWVTRERPVEVEVGDGLRAGGRHAGRGAERLGLRHGAAPRHGVVQDHRQGRSR